MSTTEVLERALMALEDEGWIKGAYCTEDGICATRAIFNAIETPWSKGGRMEMIAAVTAVGRETGMMNIAMWNDHPDRTFSQVREVFRRAAYAASKMEVEA